MTISTTDSRISYNGNGVTDEFSFPYRFFENADLVVELVGTTGVVTTQVLNTDYTVTGADLDAGGTVTMVTPPASGERLVIRRVVEATQETDYISGDPFPAESHERALDRLTMLVQQNQEALTRTLQLPPTSDADASAIDVEAVEDVAAIAADVSAVAAISADVELAADNIVAIQNAASNAAAAAASAIAADNSADAAAASAASIALPLPIASGGTGQTTVVAARAALEAARELQPLSVSVGSNALTITLNPTSIDFRSATLGSGDIFTRSVPSAISLVVSSGSTLGTVSGATENLAVLAIDNDGTVELAVVNLRGGVDLSEQGLISTTAEGGAGGADSASTVYSTSARVSKPYRILDFLEGSQVTAGTWAAAPARTYMVAPQAAWRAGYGQRWQSLTGSRALNTNYTNTTGRPIMVAVTIAYGVAGAGVNVPVTVDGVVVSRIGAFGSGGVGMGSFVVPAGGVYSVGTAASTTLNTWSELRA